MQGLLDTLADYWEVIAGTMSGVAVIFAGLYKLATDVRGYVREEVDAAIEEREQLIAVQRDVTADLREDRARLENRILDLEERVQSLSTSERDCMERLEAMHDARDVDQKQIRKLEGKVEALQTDKVRLEGRLERLRRQVEDISTGEIIVDD